MDDKTLTLEILNPATPTLFCPSKKYRKLFEAATGGFVVIRRGRFKKQAMPALFKAGIQQIEVVDKYGDRVQVYPCPSKYQQK